MFRDMTASQNRPCGDRARRDLQQPPPAAASAATIRDQPHKPPVGAF